MPQAFAYLKKGMDERPKSIGKQLSDCSRICPTSIYKSRILKAYSCRLPLVVTPLTAVQTSTHFNRFVK
jgi:hypothetical protein